MSELRDDNIINAYNLDYIGKYYFYEENEFLREKKDGEFILNKLRESNRFDYEGASYTFTKFANISEGRTITNAKVEIDPKDINVRINNELVHLDLIYKMDIKQLEDHYRITTRISEKADNISCLLYINLKDVNDFIKDLEAVKKNQQEFAKEK